MKSVTKTLYLLVGGQVGARTLNKVYLRLKAKNGGVGTPEMRYTTPYL